MKLLLQKFRTMGRTAWSAGRRVLTSFLPYSPIPGGRELLENQYARHVLHGMWSLNELPRFGVVIGYCQFFKRGGAILDVGCGEGMLQDRLCPRDYSRYVGVDISAEAIQRASSRQTEYVSFVRADAEEYVPEEKFDVIIFNECIYYFNDPLAVARRYESYLKEEGIIIVSMFVGDTARTRKAWKRLEHVYRPRAATRLSTKRGFTWIVKVYGAAEDAER